MDRPMSTPESPKPGLRARVAGLADTLTTRASLGPSSTAVTPAKRRARIATAVIAVGVAVFLIVIGLQNAQVNTSEDKAEQSTQQKERLADNLGDIASRVAAVCATADTNGTLEAAELCSRAQAAVADPEVNADVLTPAQVQEIARQALEAQLAGLKTDDTEAIAALVLARLQADPAFRGISEERVRQIVDAALAAQPKPEPGENGAPGRPGSSFEGFQRVDGQCMAVIRNFAADGTETVVNQPAGDAACAPVATTEPPPPPTTEPPPPPPPTTEPPVPTTEPPPSDAQPTVTEPPPLFP
jgi:hypothetical protein